MDPHIWQNGPNFYPDCHPEIENKLPDQTTTFGQIGGSETATIVPNFSYYGQNGISSCTPATKEEYDCNYSCQGSGFSQIYRKSEGDQPNFKDGYAPSHFPHTRPSNNDNFSELSQVGRRFGNQICSKFSGIGSSFGYQSSPDTCRPSTSYNNARYVPSEQLPKSIAPLSESPHLNCVATKNIFDYPRSYCEPESYHPQNFNNKFEDYPKSVVELPITENANTYLYQNGNLSVENFGSYTSLQPTAEISPWPTKPPGSSVSPRSGYIMPRVSKGNEIIASKMMCDSKSNTEKKSFNLTCPYRRISPKRTKSAISKYPYRRSENLSRNRRMNHVEHGRTVRRASPSTRTNSSRGQRVVSSKRKSRYLPSRKYTARPYRSTGGTSVPARRQNNDQRTNQRRREIRTGSDEKLDIEALLQKEKKIWTRTAPADLFYLPGPNYSSSLKIVCGTEKLGSLCQEFDERLLMKAVAIRAGLPKYEPLKRKKSISTKKHTDCNSSSSSSCESDGEEDHTNEELEHKKNHPLRLHQELWFNDPGEMNDGPLCRCSAKARRSGIRHNIYAGENHLPPCDPNSNNADRLHHYRITITPATNFLIPSPTIIVHDHQEYIFEGFSMFSHKKLDDLPLCKVIRFNIEYTIIYYEENFPQNFTVKELNLFYNYLFKEILELVDLDFRAAGDPVGCPQYHFMPRFVRGVEENGKEILSMNAVLKYLLQNAKPLIPREDLTNILNMPQYDWQRFTEKIKGMIVTYPGKKPSSLRVDQLDRDQDNCLQPKFPEIVHFGIRPPQLSYAGNPEYQKAWREYVKFRHLLANMPKPSYNDKSKLEQKENKLQSMRTKNELKRNVTVTVSSENFHLTGIMCDVVQHAMLIPVLVSHLRFHRSLDVLEETIEYKFLNRYLLQLALTHPSYRENFGTNPDHARNALTNCGIRQPVYGDRKIHYQNTRKRGINTLISIMSRFGKKEATESQITHNERLEFLGDAVVEFVSSVHLFHMFSELEEGGLATYRAAIVQNQHLALLAKVLHLEDFMLYAHGSDLCHDLELRHAMANCFEALMGALFLDGGIQVADKVFGKALFHDSEDLLFEWVNYPPHPLQEQEPLGDRKWVSKFKILQNLSKFEEAIGVEFNHIRLLARAFTDRSIGFTHLTLGSNQRLEFLGDTVLQLIASEYLYKYFPEHHEGHLSLLRSSLVNNRTQSVVCDDLGMTQYALYSNPKAELKTKDRADLLESFLGALYVDMDMEFCQVFCNVCFFPRLKDFILKQDWNDPKSKLQQCCLTLRTMEGGEPEIPVYKVIECMGPTNTRIYSVAVYFKNRRLAKASGHSIQQAEMNAAKKALSNSKGLFPQLDHQKRVISKSMNRQNQRKQLTSKKDQPSGRNKNIKNQTHDSRSLSPSKGKDTKTSNDAFSQKTECRELPLAYQSRNKSASPVKERIKEGTDILSKKEPFEKHKIDPKTPNDGLSQRKRYKSSQSAGQRRSRSPLSNREKKLVSKPVEDFFSQKIRCPTPPLAYRIRNQSLSPSRGKETKTANDAFSQKTECQELPLAYQSRNKSPFPAKEKIKEGPEFSSNKEPSEKHNSDLNTSNDGSLQREKNESSLSAGQRRSRSQTPKQKSKSDPKPAEDVFSQKISCLIPQLAHQNTNEPDLRSKTSEDKEKTRDQSNLLSNNQLSGTSNTLDNKTDGFSSLRIKSETSPIAYYLSKKEEEIENFKSNNLSDTYPLAKKPRRSRSNSTLREHSTHNSSVRRIEVIKPRHPSVRRDKIRDNFRNSNIRARSSNRSVENLSHSQRSSQRWLGNKVTPNPSDPAAVAETSVKSFNHQSTRHPTRTFRRRSRSLSGSRELHRHRRKSRSISMKRELKRSPLHSRNRRKSPGQHSKTSHYRRSRSSSQHRPSYFKCRARTPPKNREFNKEHVQPHRKPLAKSPHSDKFSEKEDFKREMSEFLSGKRSSPGLEVKDSTSWLFDLMYKNKPIPFNNQ